MSPEHLKYSRRERRRSSFCFCFVCLFVLGFFWKHRWTKGGKHEYIQQALLCLQWIVLACSAALSEFLPKIPIHREEIDQRAVSEAHSGLLPNGQVVVLRAADCHTHSLSGTLYIFFLLAHRTLNHTKHLTAKTNCKKRSRNCCKIPKRKKSLKTCGLFFALRAKMSLFGCGNLTHRTLRPHVEEVPEQIVFIPDPFWTFCLLGRGSLDSYWEQTFPVHCSPQEVDTKLNGIFFLAVDFHWQFHKREGQESSLLSAINIPRFSRYPEIPEPPFMQLHFIISAPHSYSLVLVSDITCLEDIYLSNDAFYDSTAQNKGENS